MQWPNSADVDSRLIVAILHSLTDHDDRVAVVAVKHLEQTTTAKLILDGVVASLPRNLVYSRFVKQTKQYQLLCWVGTISTTVGDHIIIIQQTFGPPRHLSSRQSVSPLISVGIRTHSEHQHKQPVFGLQGGQPQIGTGQTGNHWENSRQVDDVRREASELAHLFWHVTEVVDSTDID